MQQQLGSQEVTVCPQRGRALSGGLCISGSQANQPVWPDAIHHNLSFCCIVGFVSHHKQEVLQVSLDKFSEPSPCWAFQTRKLVAPLQNNKKHGNGGMVLSLSAIDIHSVSSKINFKLEILTEYFRIEKKFVINIYHSKIIILI